LPKSALGHIVQKIYYHSGAALNNHSTLVNRLH
jgi:hypothetical protein